MKYIFNRCLIILIAFGLLLSASNISYSQTETEEKLQLPAGLLSDAEREGCRPVSAPNQCVYSQSSCWVAVMLCKHCCYNENGLFAGTESSPCGICFGFDF